MTDTPAPALRDVRSPLSDGEWHRMHPLTPLLRGGLFLLVIAGVVLANMRERLVSIFVPIFTPGLADDLETPPDPIDYLVDHNLLLVVGAILLGVLAILLALFWLSWRFHTFRITGEDVEVRSGVLFRTHRRAPLDRVQGVNLTRPLFARLLGMAKLEVVGAGSDGNVKLEYLSTPHAETVRADILRLASGRKLAETAELRDDTAAPAGARPSATVVAGISGLIEGEDLDAAEPASIVHIPPVRLAASRLLSSSTLGLLLIVVVLAVGAVFDVPWIFFAFVPAAIGFVAYALRSFVRALRYAIAPTPEGVRVTFGLFTTVTEILPPGRVHALEVRQSPLWRPFGWWSIRVNRISGRASSDTTAEQLTTVLPVGTRDDVERVLRLLLPGLTEEEWHGILTEGVDGPAVDDPYQTTPSRARLLRPLAWRRNGFLLTPGVLLLRRGALWRSVGIFPLARMQSIGITQGPLDRSLAVASLTAHVVAGSVVTTVGVIDRDAAVDAFERTALAVTAAAERDRSHRWAR